MLVQHLVCGMVAVQMLTDGFQQVEQGYLIAGPCQFVGGQQVSLFGILATYQSSCFEFQKQFGNGVLYQGVIGQDFLRISLGYVVEYRYSRLC